ncbi:MAG: hypothetical protein LBR54_04345 [Oscillospiraceae bacterium]|jgi:hypothetical protein|nr:hypothetical protein [Oscillospiraceae bacterium]
MEFDRKLEELPSGTNLVYVDESGVQIQMRCTRGRAKRGAKIPAVVKGKGTKKLNVIAGYSNGKIIVQETE